LDSLELIRLNLLSPVVLCFGLGALARLLRSDLSLPESVYTALSAYLLLAIGLKGGAALAETPIRAVVGPAFATLIVGIIVPVVAYAVCRSLVRLNRVNAAAMAAHYGSVSAVTFIATLSFLRAAGEPYEGFLPALVAVLEIPAIIVGLMLGREAGARGSMGHALREVLTGKSVMLLAGGMLVGWLSGERGMTAVKPFFVDPFQGALCLFMLEMGLLAASRLGDLRRAGLRLVAFAIAGPILFGAIGVSGGWASGLGIGGSTVLGAMAASASYIAAPAAVRLALPKANPAYYLTAAVGITFPFNLSAGIPLYYAMSRWFFGM
jgi:hypothetical protein